MNKIIAIILAVCLVVEPMFALAQPFHASRKASQAERAGLAPRSEFVSDGQSENLPSGSLDGLIILRFSSDYHKPKGQQTHLQYLNRELLMRNSATIIQVYFTKDNSAEVKEERIGRGVLIQVPLIIEEHEHHGLHKQLHIKLFKLLSFFASKIGLFSFVHRILNSWLSVVFSRMPFINIYYWRSLDVDKTRDKIKDLLSRYNVDLVVLHETIYKDCLVVAEAAKVKRVPVVIVNHGSNRYLRRQDVKKLIAAVNGIAGVSSVNVPLDIGSKYRDLSDGIDCEFFRKEKADTGTLEEENIILLPASVYPGKGHLDLVKAAGRLRKKEMRMKLVFAGKIESTAYQDKIKKLAEEYGFGGIEIVFTGPVSQKEMRDWYGKCAFVVLPSCSEGLPRVLLEAQAMEKPVVAYDIDGVQEAVKDKKIGFLAPAGDIKVLAGCIEGLLSDSDRRAKMGRAGRAHVVANFSLSALAERHEEYYLQIINPPKKLADFTEINYEGISNFAIFFSAVGPHRKEYWIKVARDEGMDKFIENEWKMLLQAGQRSEREWDTRFIRPIFRGIIEEGASLPYPNNLLSGRQFIVFEKLEGQNLMKYIQDNSGLLRESKLIDIAIQCGEILRDMHKRGIIHRDLKLGNFWRMPDGSIKIFDFGISWAKEKGPIPSYLKQYGTPPVEDDWYSLEPDELCDIFSFGVLLTEFWSKEWVIHTMRDINIVFLRIDNNSIKPIISRCLADRGIGGRYKDFTEVLVGLNRLKHGECAGQVAVAV